MRSPSFYILYDLKKIYKGVQALITVFTKIHCFVMLAVDRTRGCVPVHIGYPGPASGGYLPLPGGGLCWPQYDTSCRSLQCG